MKRLILVLIGLTMLSAAPATASVIYVSGDVSGTWSADTVVVTAEVSIPAGQSLIIVPGVEVLFQANCKFIVNTNANLTAVGTANDSIRFDVLSPGSHWKGIRLLSASNSSRLEYCILKNGQATGSGEDVYGGAIYCTNSSPTISNNSISGNSATYQGGGIFCDNSSPMIRNNTFSGNSSSGGGGIFCGNSSPSISGNTISGNSGYYGGGIYCHGNSSPNISGNAISGNSANGGGGIACGYHSTSRISGNTISGNSASNSGGGIRCWDYSDIIIDSNTISENTATYYGGGILCQSSNPTISNNFISGNSATYGGGGIYGENSNATISNNTIDDNSAHQGGGIECHISSPTITNNNIIRNSATGTYGEGGGMYCYDSNPSIIDNTINTNLAVDGGGVYFTSSPNSFQFNEITENSASERGGGLYLSGVIFTINKNTIAGNNAVSGGGIYRSYSTLTIINSILWGNSPQQIFQSGTGNVQVTYSDIQGSWSGVGNIDSLPLFVNPALHDYRLQFGSPCINTGDPNLIYNDPDGSRADMGCYYYGWVGVHEPVTDQLPREFAVSLYPNPFNPSTTISYELRVPSQVNLKVYDTSGRLVTNLVNGFRQAGSHEITFDGSGLASGLYLYRLTAGSQMASGKMVLLK